MELYNNIVKNVMKRKNIEEDQATQLVNALLTKQAKMDTKLTDAENRISTQVTDQPSTSKIPVNQTLTEITQETITLNSETQPSTSRLQINQTFPETTPETIAQDSYTQPSTSKIPANQTFPDIAQDSTVTPICNIQQLSSNDISVTTNLASVSQLQNTVGQASNTTIASNFCDTPQGYLFLRHGDIMINLTLLSNIEQTHNILFPINACAEQASDSNNPPQVMILPSNPCCRTVRFYHPTMEITDLFSKLNRYITQWVAMHPLIPLYR